MTVAPPTPDSPIRLRLKCSNAEDFATRFAPNVTRGGIFLPTREAHEVGASIRFEIRLENEQVVFAGEGVVTWAKPKGLGVRFTTLDAASEPMLELLLSRRQPTPAAPADVAAVQTKPAPEAERAVAEPAAMPATDSKPTAPAAAPAPPVALAPIARPVSGAAEPGVTPPLGMPATNSTVTPPLGMPATDAKPTASTAGSPRDPKRSLFRPSVALATTAVVIAIVIVSVSVGRARLGARSPANPAASIVPATAAAPAVEVPSAPAEAASARSNAAPPEAPPELAPSPVAAQPAKAAARSTSSAGPSGLHVESMLVGASYQGFTCPNPTGRLSVRSTRNVNVCLQVTHRPGRAERFTLVWERNGAFSGKTPLEIPASRPSVHTRAHMKISENRLGSWSVRAVSERNAPLAQATFVVVP